MFRFSMSNEDFVKYRDEWLNRPSPESIRKYFSGFKRKEEKPMFDEELDELENVYTKTLENLKEERNDCIPYLVRFMKDFIRIYETEAVIEEKLESLKAKLVKGEE